MIKKHKTISLNMGLCEGRHEIPQVTDGYIFPSEVNPTDIDGLRRTAWNKLCETYKNKGLDIDVDMPVLHLYVTGLTVALVEVINVCRKLDITLRLYHYNRETNDYYVQIVY